MQQLGLIIFREEFIGDAKGIVFRSRLALALLLLRSLISSLAVGLQYQVFLAALSRMNLELSHTRLTIRLHGLVGLSWWTFLVFLFENLRKILAC